MNSTNKTYAIIDKSINQKLIDELQNNGEDVFRFPEITITENNLDSSGNKLLKELYKFDWIIFTDVFAVEFFINNLQQNEIDLFILDNLRVCSFGESVADRLRFVQIHSDIIANKIDEKEIFKQIKDYIFDADEFSELKVLMIKGEKQVYEIVRYFERAGSNTTELDVYIINEIENSSKIKTLTNGGAFDEYIFCSVDEVFEINNFFHPQRLHEALNEIEVYAKDEITLQALREFGFSPKLYK